MADSPETVEQRVLAASPFVARFCARHPDWRSEGLLERARQRGEIAALAREAAATVADEAALMRALRRLRGAEMPRIAYRDLAGLAQLDETLGDLSDLADACVQAALDFCMERRVAAHGCPTQADGAPARPVVLGMGKLGGRELNFSSDIDLIFFHTASGACLGGPPDQELDNEQFFVRLSQDVCRVLSAMTEDGFVFRTDTLLRPYGSSGPLSTHFAYAENYYLNHGRDWERYALIKARPVAGDLAAGFRLLRRLQPFVYRRYLDFGAIESLRQLKRLIEEDVSRRRLEGNVKLGVGGIRELEFVVQSFQLVHGGQQPRLRDSRLRQVLHELGATGALTPEDARRLDDGYVFLRRLENAIQMYDDRQTHALPQSAEPRTALCRALGFADWGALVAHLGPVQDAVHEQFRSVFAEPGAAASGSNSAALVEGLWHDAEASNTEERLRRMGFAQAPERVRAALAQVRQARLLRTLSEASIRRLQQMLPLLLEVCAQQAQPEETAERVLRVVQSIAGRSTYLSLLRESATARTQLARLCAASPWISTQLVQSPSLLGSLLDERALYAVPTREDLRLELEQRLGALPLEEVEPAMDTLRRFRQEMMLRVAASDVAGALPLVKVSDRLTWLAEVVLAAALARARTALSQEHGTPRNRDGSEAGFAAIAYGKFGGIELGYGSDLDLVFLHDCDAPEAETVCGARAITAAAFMMRLAQRLVHWLSTLTPAGRAYEVDLELRPSGRSGLPVASLTGFEDYQRHHAWTWEHQALTRARCVAGSPRLAAAFEALRLDILRQPRDATKLRADVLDMRKRMRAQLERRRPGLWDVKQGGGGIVDIEFIVQFLLLRDAARHPDIVRWSDNWRQLEDLAAVGLVSAQDKDRLIVIYRAYRTWGHACALQQNDPLAPEAQFAHERAQVQEYWNQYFE